MARHSVIPHDDPRYPAIHQRLIYLWIRTLLGYLAFGGLIFLTMKFMHVSAHVLTGFNLLWILLPIPMWWYSAKIALYMTKSTPADPNNPVHARLLAVVDRLWPKTGLKFKPPVYISDNPLPNAFATGPIHSRAVVAATRGLFDCGMTDDELEAVFLHEIAGHVKHYDVGINSLISVLSSIWFLLVDSGVQVLLGTINILRRVTGVKPITLGAENQGFVGTIIGWILFYAVFWLTGQVSQLIQLFVVRSRESAADAAAAEASGNPCALVTALLKLVAFIEKHPPKGRERELFRVLRPMMIVDPLYDTLTVEPQPKNWWQRLQRWYAGLKLTHPPVPDRVDALEKMNGAKCPAPTAA